MRRISCRWRRTSGSASTASVTRRAKRPRSTASALPAGTFTWSATRTMSESIRRISSFSRPAAWSRELPRRLLEDTSSARSAVWWTGVPRTGRISWRSTGTPRRANCQAASHPASPPPTMVTPGGIATTIIALGPHGETAMDRGASTQQPAMFARSEGAPRTRLPSVPSVEPAPTAERAREDFPPLKGRARASSSEGRSERLLRRPLVVAGLVPAEHDLAFLLRLLLEQVGPAAVGAGLGDRLVVGREPAFRVAPAAVEEPPPASLALDHLALPAL